MSQTTNNCVNRLGIFVELIDKLETAQTFEDLKPIVQKLIFLCSEISGDISREAIRNNSLHSLMYSTTMEYAIGLKKMDKEYMPDANG